MSRGSVYYLPRPVSEADLALMRRIDELHLEHPYMGARMLRRMLVRQSFKVGRRHVGTLMQRMGIEALCPQPGTSKAAPGHKIYPYLLRKITITQSNQVWALDTTYIPMARGFVYLTAVVDVPAARCSRTRWLSRWRRVMPGKSLSRRSCDLEHLILSIRTKGASSPPKSSPTSSWPKAANSAWMAEAPGVTTCLSSACGAA